MAPFRAARGWPRAPRAGRRADADLGYGSWAGAPRLRAVLAAYLGRARGVVADPDNIVVTAGITQAIALLAGLLRARGARRVLVEEPGFWQHRTILQRAGLELVPVDVDDGGLRTDALPPAAAALVTPAHQFPTGGVLAPERRAALLDVGGAHDALVIEDDYDGEYRYDREPLGALQGLGAGRVAYLGSTSKTLAPALRLGWIVLPGALAGAIADERGWADGGSPTLDQLALASFIDRGELDRHLRRMRLRYRRRRDRLVAASASTSPTTSRRGGGRAARHRGAGARRRRRRRAGAGDRARRRGLRRPARRPPAAPGRLRQHRRGGHRARRPRAGGRRTRLGPGRRIARSQRPVTRSSAKPSRRHARSRSRSRALRSPATARAAPTRAPS